MVVGQLSSRTEVAVIGSGPGGYVAALRAADSGLDVTLIDPNPLGGTCLNVGCIPSKALIEVADLHHRATHSTSLGLIAQMQVDMPTVQQHLQSVTAGLRTGVGSLLSNAGVSVIAGIAHFARPDRLSIEIGESVQHLEFDDVIVATGSRPITLDAFPLGSSAGGAKIVDSTGALAVTALPASVAVVGGGYIGVELGTAFAKLGAAATIIEAAPSILGGVAPQLRRVVERRLSDLGVRVLTDTKAMQPNGAAVVTDSGESIDAELTIIAIGRRPNSDTCSLDTTGVHIDPQGFVTVDEHQRAAPNVYAIGDLTRGPALAHRASADAERCVAAILGHPVVASGVIPEVIFSDPEIVSVGTTLTAADRQGLSVHRFPHAASARAATIGANAGLTLLVADAEGTILGIHAVGPHVSELAGEAALAVEMAAHIDDLAFTVHPHPTMSETLAEAASLARGFPLHIRA